jgi:hypothetical protein
LPEQSNSIIGIKKQQAKEIIMKETSIPTHQNGAEGWGNRYMAESPERTTRIKALSAAFTLEDQICRIMNQENVSGKELAERLHTDRAVISRDLNGGLSEAKYGRIVRVADALDCDIISLIIPRKMPQRKNSLNHALKSLARAATF